MNDQLQRSLISPEKLERNQCTLIALAAGITARIPGQTRNIPSASRAKLLASELRWREWAQSEKGSFEGINPHSSNEKIVASLRHDIRNANHGRDYRSLCIFLAEYLEQQEIAIRVFDVLRSGAGDTSLQVNVIGGLALCERRGFLDLLAAGGHMRRMRRDGETLHSVLRGWLGHFKDFATVFRWTQIEDVLDHNKCDFGHTPRFFLPLMQA